MKIKVNGSQKLIIFFMLIGFMTAFQIGNPLQETFFTKNIALNITAHIENIGDVEGHDNQWIGTKGQSLRLEGFSITIAGKLPQKVNAHLEYMAHIQDIGDTPYQSQGTYVGTRDEGKRLEGFAIRFTGSDAQAYEIAYKAHLQDTGDTPFYKNGQFCGTRGQSRRVQAIYVVLTKKSNA